MCPTASELAVDPPLTSAQRRALALFLALGILARVLRWCLAFPLWGDEAYQAANSIPRAASPVLGPLGWGMVAPPGFVAAEHAMAAVFGFGELALRFVPAAAGVLALFVFARIARLALAGWPRVLAVATLAASYYPTRHAVEVKPYSTDLFVALVLLWLALEHARAPERRRFAWAFALALPVSLWCSFPAAFVAGGLLLALAPRALRGIGRWPFAVGGALLLASFAALRSLVLGAQMSHEQYLFELWSHTFPPWREPLELLRWLFETNAGRMMAHPAGGSGGGSVLTLALVVLGAVLLWRSQKRMLLGMLLAPFALNLVAAGMHAYPYGGSARWMLHLAPAICLLFAVGLAWCVRASSTARTGRAVVVALSMLAALGVFTTARAAIKPYKNLHDLEARAFARWYWSDRGDGAVRLDLATDLGWNLFPTFPEGAPAQYLCNLVIVRGAAPDPEQTLVAAREGRPLRITFAHPRDDELDPATRSAWLASMEACGFELLSEVVFDLPRRKGASIERYERIESSEWRARDGVSVSWPGRGLSVFCVESAEEVDGAKSG